MSVILRRYVSLLNDLRAEARDRNARVSVNRAKETWKGWRTGRINGKFKKLPTNGSWRRKVMMTGKKSLESK
jgi:hypothetical protein